MQVEFTLILNIILPFSILSQRLNKFNKKKSAPKLLAICIFYSNQFKWRNAVLAILGRWYTCLHSPVFSVERSSSAYLLVESLITIRRHSRRPSSIKRCTIFLWWSLRFKIGYNNQDWLEYSWLYFIEESGYKRIDVEGYFCIICSTPTATYRKKLHLMPKGKRLITADT